MAVNEESLKNNLDNIRSEIDNYFRNRIPNYIGIMIHEQEDLMLKFMLVKLAQMQTEIDEIKKPKEFKSNGYKPKRLPCMKKKDN